MKFKTIFYLLGRLFFIIGAFLLLPLFVSLFYRETQDAIHFLETAVGVCVIGFLLFWSCSKARDEPITVRDGFLLAIFCLMKFVL